MRDNSGSGKSKNNLRDPTLKEHEAPDGGASSRGGDDQGRRKDKDAETEDNASALGGHVATRSSTAPTPEEERTQ